jgi:hypothetical protein
VVRSHRLRARCSPPKSSSLPTSCPARSRLTTTRKVGLCMGMPVLRIRRHGLSLENFRCL